MVNQQDYYREDGMFRATDYFIQLYKEQVEEINIKEVKSEIDLSDTVTLYHGTTFGHLNSILKYGILPRAITNIDNWEDVELILPSTSNVVYLTNKWHYFYAYQATGTYMEKNYQRINWWDTGETFPCYVECVVPKALLVADEDFFNSKYMTQKIKTSIKKGKELTVSWEESLAHYATVGVLGGVQPEWIRSFSVLAEPKLYYDFFLGDTPYSKEFWAWTQGKGKGKIKLIDMMKREDQSLSNATWMMKDAPKGWTRISEVGVNPETGNLAIVWTRT